MAKVDPAAIAEYMIRVHGVSPETVAGILANIEYESGFQPDVVGDGGTSGGLFQHHAQRWAGLKSFAQSRGLEWTDWKTQVDYAVSEAQGYGINLQNTDPAAAAREWTLRFERPANAQVQAERRAAAVPKYVGLTPAAQSQPDIPPGPAPSGTPTNARAQTGSGVTLPDQTAPRGPAPRGPQAPAMPALASRYTGSDVPQGEQWYWGEDGDLYAFTGRNGNVFKAGNGGAGEFKLLGPAPAGFMEQLVGIPDAPGPGAPQGGYPGDPSQPPGSFQPPRTPTGELVSDWEERARQQEWDTGAQGPPSGPQIIPPPFSQIRRPSIASGWPGQFDALSPADQETLTSLGIERIPGFSTFKPGLPIGERYRPPGAAPFSYGFAPLSNRSGLDPQVIPPPPTYGDRLAQEAAYFGAPISPAMTEGGQQANLGFRGQTGFGFNPRTNAQVSTARNTPPTAIRSVEPVQTAGYLNKKAWFDQQQGGGGQFARFDFGLPGIGGVIDAWNRRGTTPQPQTNELCPDGSPKPPGGLCLPPVNNEDDPGGGGGSNPPRGYTFGSGGGTYYDPITGQTRVIPGVPSQPDPWSPPSSISASGGYYFDENGNIRMVPPIPDYNFNYGTPGRSGGGGGGNVNITYSGGGGPSTIYDVSGAAGSLARSQQQTDAFQNDVALLNMRIEADRLAQEAQRAWQSGETERAQQLQLAMFAANNALDRQTQRMNQISQFQEAISSTNPLAFQAFQATGGGDLGNALATGGNALTNDTLAPAAALLQMLENPSNPVIPPPEQAPPVPPPAAAPAPPPAQGLPPEVQQGLAGLEQQGWQMNSIPPWLQPYLGNGQGFVNIGGVPHTITPEGQIVPSAQFFGGQYEQAMQPRFDRGSSGYRGAAIVGGNPRSGDPTKGAYPELVVGDIQRVIPPEETKRMLGGRNVPISRFDTGFSAYKANAYSPDYGSFSTNTKADAIPPPQFTNPSFPAPGQQFTSPGYQVPGPNYTPIPPPQFTNPGYQVPGPNYTPIPDLSGYIDRIRGLREGLDFPGFGFMDLGYWRADPISQAIANEGLQSKYAIPVAASQWQRGRNLPQGLNRGGIRLGV